MTASQAEKSKNHSSTDPAGALEAARAGDSQAFSSLTEPYRLELLTHCYRMLGSIEDAEDQVQETFLRAWRRLETYEGRASFRAWLYKIATNACLDALDRRPKRSMPVDFVEPCDPAAPLPAPNLEPVWIEPFPDEWLSPASSSPEARYDVYESISLAFLVALQNLSPRQRTALILADVLDWSIAAIADTLGVSVSATTSLLHRARMTLKQRNTTEPLDRARMGIPDDQTRQLLDRYASAWEAADIDGIVALLTAGATLPMPPLPLWFQGQTAIRAFIAGTILAGEAKGRWKLLPIRANGQPGFAFYRLDASGVKYQSFALQVLTIEDNLVADAATFGFPQLFQRFGLPEEL